MNHLHQQYKASSHFDHTFHTQFYALVRILKHLMIRMLLTCGYWEVDDEVEPISPLVQTLGVTSTLCLYCYAMLVDVDWLSVSTTDVRVVN